MSKSRLIIYPPEWGIKPVPHRLRIPRGIDYLVPWSSLAVGLPVMQTGVCGDMD
jgi:hypothetical protein